MRIFLTRLGFRVDAFDVSVPGIDKIKYISRKEGLGINAFICDMRDYNFRGIL